MLQWLCHKSFDDNSNNCSHCIVLSYMLDKWLGIVWYLNWQSMATSLVDFPEPWKPTNTITVCVTYPDMPFIASIRSGWSHVHYTLNLLLQIHRIDAVCYFRARISAMVAGNVEVGKLVRRLYLYLYFYRKIYYKEVDDRLAVNKLKFTYSHLYNVDFSEPE